MRNLYYSSETMYQIDDKSVNLAVTSPPYNTDVPYGNKTSKGHNVIHLRKRAIPDTSISFDRIEISCIVLETILNI